MQENIGWAKLITMLKEKRTESGSPKMLNVGYASKKKICYTASIPPLMPVTRWMTSLKGF